MFSNLRLALLTLAVVAVVASIAGYAGASDNDPLPTWSVTLTPNWVSPQDGAASNYQNVWVYSEVLDNPVPLARLVQVPGALPAARPSCHRQRRPRRAATNGGS